MVFNRVISSSRKIFCYFRPPVSQDLLILEQSDFFLVCPAVFVDVGVKVVVPAFPTLFA